MIEVHHRRESYWKVVRSSILAFVFALFTLVFYCLEATSPQGGESTLIENGLYTISGAGILFALLYFNALMMQNMKVSVDLDKINFIHPKETMSVPKEQIKNLVLVNFAKVTKIIFIEWEDGTGVTLRGYENMEDLSRSLEELTHDVQRKVGFGAFINYSF